MNVNDNGQALIENHLYGGVEISQVIHGDSVGLPVPEHRLRIHAQPHMVESHRLDQRAILSGGPRFKMFFGVALLIVNLRKPLAQINSVAQMLGVTFGDA